MMKHTYVPCLSWLDSFLLYHYDNSGCWHVCGGLRPTNYTVSNNRAPCWFQQHPSCFHQHCLASDCI